MDDRTRVEELLGRPPRGPFDVVVRDDHGDPVVVRNAPFLDDGTPMPTRYYLVGRELVAAVSRLEAAGGVRAAEAEIDPQEIEAVHRRHAEERDAAINPDHIGPRPFGGVGGTRTGVKCLHAHVAHHLVTGDDPVGEWALARLDVTLPAPHRAPASSVSDLCRHSDPQPAAGSLVVLPGDHQTDLEMVGGGRWTLPFGSVGLAEDIFAECDPPRPEVLSNALGLVHDHFEDVLMDAPTLLAAPAVRADGDHAVMLARVELGTDTVPDGCVLERPAVEEVFRTIVAEDHALRATNPGLDRTYVRSIVGTCCIILGIMRRLEADELTVDVRTVGARSRS